MFELNSNFYNNSNNIFLKFEMLNSTTNFDFYLDKLIILGTSCLNVSAIIDIEDISNLLEFQISSYYNSSLAFQTLNFSIYCYYNSSWVLLNSSITADFFAETSFILNNTDISKFFLGTELMLVWYAENYTTQFDLLVDFCECKIYNILELTYDLAFDLLGTWRYRWIIAVSYTHLTLPTTPYV